MLCRLCYRQLKKKAVPKASYLRNNLDAGKVPRVLEHLFVVEKRLLSLIPVFLTLIVLPGGQLAQHGVAVNIPIDMNEQLSLLPSIPPTTGSILISFERPRNEPVTLPVRMHVLYEALHWLKQYNPLYEQVDISHFQSSQELSDIDSVDCCEDLIQEEFGLTMKDSFLSENITSGESADVTHCTLPIATGRPVTLKDLPYGEEKAFPWLFPLGRNGISTERPVALSNLSYFHARLYNVDPRWRTDIPYIMSALNQHEWSVLSSLVSTYMRTYKPVRGSVSSFVPVTAHDLNNARDDPVLLQNSYMFTKQIRGTAAYWKSVLLRLLAMVKSLGPPTFFITLSCNDNWPELKAFLDLNKIHSDRNTVKDDPFMAALAFQRRWSSLLKNVLRKKKPLGRVIEFFSRVEFQARGSPHMHIFVWSDLGFNFSNASSKDIVKVINRTICTKLPSIDSDSDMHRLVKVFQVHKHSFTCKKGNRVCRFGFPRHPCIKTKLCFNPDVIVHHRGRFYETERSSADIWVNAYNPVILRHWRANMDISLLAM